MDEFGCIGSEIARRPLIGSLGYLVIVLDVVIAIEKLVLQV